MHHPRGHCYCSAAMLPHGLTSNGPIHWKILSLHCGQGRLLYGLPELNIRYSSGIATGNQTSSGTAEGTLKVGCSASRSATTRHSTM
jgi:hypothetical protein